MNFYFKKILAESLMFMLFLSIISMEFILFFVILENTLITGGVLGLSSYIYSRIRTFVMRSMDNIIDIKLKLHFQYNHINQVMGDLMRNRKIYFEFVHNDMIVKGRAKLNEKDIMEITLKNNIMMSIDMHYDYTVESLLKILQDNNAIIVQAERYEEAMKQYKCEYLLF